MSTTLEKVRSEITVRLDELTPLVDEHRDLTAALEALGAPTANGNGHRTTRRRSTTPARKPASTRGRPAGGGKTQTRIIELITESPGLMHAAIAEKLGIKPNYLYRALPQLVEAGKIVKHDDKSYHPA